MAGFTPDELDTTKPHPARMYDYYLGGKDNYPVDKAAAAQVIQRAPEAPLIAKANRAFLGRAVRYLATECGIRQFLDIGTGIPTAGNVHEIAGKAAPGTVYQAATSPAVLRSRQEVAALFDGWDLIDPGLVQAPRPPRKAEKSLPDK